jgi:hypothetical protein
MGCSPHRSGATTSDLSLTPPATRTHHEGVLEIRPPICFITLRQLSAAPACVGALAAFAPAADSSGSRPASPGCSGPSPNAHSPTAAVPPSAAATTRPEPPSALLHWTTWPRPLRSAPIARSHPSNFTVCPVLHLAPFARPPRLNPSPFEPALVKLIPISAFSVSPSLHYASTDY